MKLQIEKWVDETRPFKELDPANEFFEESVRCYKIGAYKSAFIMSYLAFKTTIRNRILECTYGEELVRSNPRFWEDEIIKKLENDDLWESHLNSIVEASCADNNNKKPIAILHFTNGEQIKTSYNNWRNIRNDCAHAKRHVTIDSSTVESFWNYLIDNLSKFYVLGGEKYLLKELENLHKFYRYPEIVQRETVHTIISDVNVIANKNSKEFFQQLFENLMKTVKGELVNDANEGFWRDILASKHENIRDGVIQVISSDASLFLNFYNYYPQILEMSFSLNPKFIVNDLVNWLNEPFYFYDYGKTFWAILVEILDKYEEHVDVSRVVTRRTIDLIASFEHDDRSLRILNSNDVFKKYIISVSSWFFETSAGPQFDNFTRFNSESKYVELCFNYLQWDRECINILDYSLVNLEQSMTSRVNSVSRMNGHRYKSICNRIICSNKDKITSVPDVNLDEYIEISKILNICKSDNQDSTETLSNTEQNEAN